MLGVLSRVFWYVEYTLCVKFWYGLWGVLRGEKSSINGLCVRYAV